MNWGRKIYPTNLSRFTILIIILCSMCSLENKKYWENCSSDYAKVWETCGRQEMSRRELSFISKYVLKCSPHRILDIGVGNGRILNTLIHSASAEANIFGLYISEEMVKICREKFKNEAKVKQISVYNL